MLQREGEQYRLHCEILDQSLFHWLFHFLSYNLGFFEIIKAIEWLAKLLKLGSVR